MTIDLHTFERAGLGPERIIAAADRLKHVYIEHDDWRAPVVVEGERYRFDEVELSATR